MSIIEVLRRESVYIWYYFEVQLFQILPYWAAGIVLGSAVSVFVKDKIRVLSEKAGNGKHGLFALVPASILGIISPLCMYGTIPLAASFSQKGVKDDFLAAFMMSSILLNPQLIIYSSALGKTALFIRIGSCFVCGIAAGLLVHFFGTQSNKNGKSTNRPVDFFTFEGFAPSATASRDTAPNMMIRLLKNIGRNIRATGVYFLVGILLSALFQRYVPQEAVAKLFGKNEGFPILMAATLGVPLYVCGGGTIPLLMDWLSRGMSMGAAASFMITGPATKITNLGALKIILGAKHFALYMLFVIVFSVLTGWTVNFFVPAA